MPNDFLPLDKAGCCDVSVLRDRVMVISNEDEPIKIGTVNGFHVMQNGQRVPGVVCDGKELLCFGVILPFDDALFSFLSGLEYKERFKLLSRVFAVKNEVERQFYRR